MIINLETRILNVVDDAILPLTGRQIYAKLWLENQELLQDDVIDCLWKLVREDKLIIRLDLKVIRKNSHVSTSCEFEGDESRAEYIRLSEASAHARRAIRDFLEGRIDRAALHDSAIAHGIILDRNKITAGMQAVVEKLSNELSLARDKLHEFDNKKVAK